MTIICSIFLVITRHTGTTFASCNISHLPRWVDPRKTCRCVVVNWRGPDSISLK